MKFLAPRTSRSRAWSPQGEALRAGLAIAVCLLSGTSALANPSSVGPDVQIVEGPGIKIGEGTVIHPTVGAEIGAVSNIFFTEASAANAALLRILAQVSIGSLSPKRLATSSAEAAQQDATSANKGDLEFRGTLALQYNEFLSTNDNVTSQRGLGIRSGLQAVAFPMRTWAFKFHDAFSRAIRPTNFESPITIDRDTNILRLALAYQPQGRSIHGSLRYENTLDIFERDAHGFADRIHHLAGLNVSWQWLPVTKFYTDVSLGYFTGLGADSTKVTSMPLRAVAGVETALSVDTTLTAHAGYGQGFYASGPDFANFIGGAAFGYQFSELGKLSFTYDYGFQDSINANFFRDHAFRFNIQQVFMPFTVSVTADARLRQYQGLLVGGAVRDDLIFNFNAGAFYNFRDWLAATADYTVLSAQTDFTYAVDGLVLNPSYTRHMFLLGLRVAL